MSHGPAAPTIEGMTETILMAQTGWPDAAVAIAGIGLVTTVAVVVIWQALSTWRTRIAVTREQAYQKLANEMVDELHDINERLQRIEEARR